MSDTNLSSDCPHCGHALQAPGTAAGDTMQCPSCSQSLEVPSASSDPSYDVQTNSSRHGVLATAAALITVSVLCGVMISRCGSTSSPPTSTLGSAEKDASLPEYTILKKDLRDDRVKAQVAFYALVQSEADETNLMALLHKLHSDASKETGFERRSRTPTHVFVYLYVSRKHYDARMGEWVAMLSRIGSAAPETRINAELLATETPAP